VGLKEFFARLFSGPREGGEIGGAHVATGKQSSLSPEALAGWRVFKAVVDTQQ